MMKISLVTLLHYILPFLVLLTNYEIHGAHSRRRPTVRSSAPPRYDREITTFSEDGRLKQVEYGMEAADRGDAVITVVINETLAIVSTSPDKVHRLDAHILLVTSGLKGDGRFLASHLRKACQEHRSYYDEAPTVKEIADLASNFQHELTKHFGVRPFGCTAIVLGVTEGELKLYQSEPGGGLDECTFCVAGRKKLTILDKLKGIMDEVQHAPNNVNGACVKNITAATHNLLHHDADKDEDDDRKTDLWVIRAGEEALKLTCLKSVDNDSIQDFFMA